MNENPDWYEFQEEICSYLISLGAFARTNISVEGVRTHHDIDVLVEFPFIGEKIKWFIEAKKWKKKVNKLQVLALRTIVEDTGADRGYIISEQGFQSGAMEAANNSNIYLYTFEEFKKRTNKIVEIQILKSIIERIQILENKYLRHDISIRKEYQLKESNMFQILKISPTHLFLNLFLALKKGLKNNYPIEIDDEINNKVSIILDHKDLINWANIVLNYLDKRLYDAEMKMIKDNKYKPTLEYRENVELPISMLIEKL